MNVMKVMGIIFVFLMPMIYGCSEKCIVECQCQNGTRLRFESKNSDECADFAEKKSAESGCDCMISHEKKIGF